MWQEYISKISQSLLVDLQNKCIKMQIIEKKMYLKKLEYIF